MRPGTPDVVLRAGRAVAAVTFGPAFVAVSDGPGPPRSFPRDDRARGAVARLRAHLVDGPPAPVPPEICRLSLVDGRGDVLVGLPWTGADHAALEAACATACIPLDRIPDQDAGRGFDTGGLTAIDHGAGKRVILVADGSTQGRGRRAPVGLVLGPREVVVTGVDGGLLRWPRLGCADPAEPAVARLCVTLFAERPPDRMSGPPATDRVLALTLFAIGDRPLAHLRWHSRDLAAVQRACAAAGVLVEYRWQPHGNAADLARHGVPVIHATGPTASVTGAVRPAVAGTGRRRLPAVSEVDRPRWWLYAASLLVLAASAVAVVMLSG